MSNTRLAIYLTRSLLHVGTGQSLGDIDRPVSRQITTQLPNLPGSPQKRAIKDALTIGPPGAGGAPVAALTARQTRALFGADALSASYDGAGPAVSTGATGLLAPQEGELLLLPVACGAGGCAWVTSPSVWARFRREARRAGVGAPALPELPKRDCALCPEDSPLVTRIGGADGAWVVLGPASLGHQVPAVAAATADATAAQAWKAWADWTATTTFGADDAEWQTLVARRLTVVPDAVFDPLVPQALANRARNRVVEKAGASIALWREEAVPEDTVFHALLSAQVLDTHREVFDRPQAALEDVARRIGNAGLSLQLGGLGSVGHGHLLLRLIEPHTDHSSHSGPVQGTTHAS